MDSWWKESNSPQRHGNRIAAWVLGPLAVICGGGCPDRGIDLGPFGRVSGRVSFQGAPLREGMITFHCPESGQVATADIQPDGSYAMKLDDRDGLPLGHYNVSVRPTLAKSQEHFRRPKLRRQVDEDSHAEIPMRYRFETSSGLTAAVQEGENSVDFDLTDAGGD